MIIPSLCRMPLPCRYDKYYQTPRIWLYGYDEVSVRHAPDFMEYLLTSHVATVLHVALCPTQSIRTIQVLQGSCWGRNRTIRLGCFSLKRLRSFMLLLLSPVLPIERASTSSNPPTSLPSRHLPQLLLSSTHPAIPFTPYPLISSRLPRPSPIPFLSIPFLSFSFLSCPSLPFPSLPFLSFPFLAFPCLFPLSDSQSRQPLTPEDVFDDVSQDHAKKTVSVRGSEGRMQQLL